MMIEVDVGENQDFYLIVQIRFEFLLNVAIKIEETIEQFRRQYNFAFQFNYVKREIIIQSTYQLVRAIHILFKLWKKNSRIYSMYWPSHTASGHANFVGLKMKKKLWIKINEIVVNISDCFVIGAKILLTKKFLQVWEWMGISRCNISRIGTIIQFDEANLSNSNLNNVALVNAGALSWRSSTLRLTLPRPFSTMTERSRSMIDASEGALIVIPRGRYSVSRTPSFIPENDHHHNLSSWSFLAESSWCLFT